MKLLKIGPLNGDSSRWLDALEVFDEIHVVLFAGNPETRVRDPRVVYHEFDCGSLPSKVVLKILRKASKVRSASLLAGMAVRMLSWMNGSCVDEMEGITFDRVHVSYNDFDESGIILLALEKPLGIVSFTRSYKESRPGFDWVERQVFMKAARIVLNEKECLDFFSRKYGSAPFNGTELVFGLDEDYVGSKAHACFSPQEKLSSIDGLIHLVILAGRVMSDPADRRSGSRLYYIPMIEGFLSAGYCVHLHTMRVIPDADGVDRYGELAKASGGRFVVESSLDFFGAGKREAFEILSRYDFGVMHNYIDGTSNTEFDRYNIPHRYYEYEVAGVVPVLQKGKTVVLERFLEESMSGCVYRDPSELRDFDRSQIRFNTPTFGSYIRELYGDES